MPVLPKYPVYIPSKGRWDHCLTARCLLRDSVPFRLVVEPQEYDKYAERFGEDRLLVLPWNDPPLGVSNARNWIKEHATAEGHERHWQIDDNISKFTCISYGRGIPCKAGIALRAAEDFVDRYENIAVAGLNYDMFIVLTGKRNIPPFYLNSRVYSCSLILNSLPHKWRTVYNEDSDYCLQVLTDGWCTVNLNVFTIMKMRTMIISGGNTPKYQGDGRLKMARELERLWPGVVKTIRRYGRPQHWVNWKAFDTPLKKKPGAPDGPILDGVKIRLVTQNGRILSDRDDVERFFEEQRCAHCVQKACTGREVNGRSARDAKRT